MAWRRRFIHSIGESKGMSERRIPVPADFLRTGTMDNATYERLYRESVEDPERFWGEQAERLHWFGKWNKVVEQDFANAKHQWFVGGKLNASYQRAFDVSPFNCHCAPR